MTADTLVVVKERLDVYWYYCRHMQVVQTTWNVSVSHSADQDQTQDAFVRQQVAIVSVMVFQKPAVSDVMPVCTSTCCLPIWQIILQMHRNQITSSELFGHLLLHAMSHRLQ